jgi:transcriptional regulator with XRE-family HTH domain
MIPPIKVKQVQELLALGKTYRAIERITGVSRNTIGGIKNGKHREESLRAINGNGLSYLPLRELPKAECPTCHKIGYHPCVECRAKECDSIGKRKARIRYDAICGIGAEDIFPLQLTAEELERAREIQQVKNAS